MPDISKQLLQVRKGVIGYVEHKAGIVEVIYYDRLVN